MQRTELPVPGDRDVVATLDEPDETTSREADETTPDAVVVACPPHPQAGGNRGDRRLRAVADGLVEAGVACLRLDYGPWDDGYGEVEDARNALRWAAGRFDRVGLFGFSFGGGVAVLAGASFDGSLRAVSVLAPGSRLNTDLDAVAALERVVDPDGPAVPVQVVYGTRDTTADWEPLVERARELDCEVVELAADHFFVGQHEKVAEAVVPFLAARL